MNKIEFLENNKNKIAKLIAEINTDNDAAMAEYLMTRIMEIISNSASDITFGMLEEKLIQELGKYEEEEYDEVEEVADTKQPLYEDDTYCEDAMSQYRKDVEKFPLLTAEQEKELFKRYNNGDQKAKELLINSNLRLVIKIAGRYANNNVQLLDLIQEGNIGLQTAVERFDVSLGNKLSTYATWWIRQAITRSIPDMSLQYRIPVHVEQAKWKIIKAENLIYNTTGKEATFEEISKMTGIAVDEIKRVKKATTQATSLYKLLNDEDDSTTLGDMIADDKVSVEDTSMSSQLRADLMKAIDNDLTEREKNIIIERFGLNNGSISTLGKVGNDYHVTRERIRQIEARALHKLRRKEKHTGLSEYLN